VKVGLFSGSFDQHCSMSSLHWGSHDAGIGGLSVLLKIPPENVQFVIRNPHSVRA
jgi:hypothetical protein